MHHAGWTLTRRCSWISRVSTLTGRRSRSVFADKLFDAALKLPFLLLAPAQPLVKVGDRQLGFRAERNADELSRHQTTRARKERPLRAMATDICSLWSLTAVLNSILAPWSEMLRTTQSLVAPSSPISATPP